MQLHCNALNQLTNYKNKNKTKLRRNMQLHFWPRILSHFPFTKCCFRSNLKFRVFTEENNIHNAASFLAEFSSSLASAILPHLLLQNTDFSCFWSNLKFFTKENNMHNAVTFSAKFSVLILCHSVETLLRKRSKLRLVRDGHSGIAIGGKGNF